MHASYKKYDRRRRYVASEARRRRYYDDVALAMCTGGILDKCRSTCANAFVDIVDDIGKTRLSSLQLDEKKVNECALTQTRIDILQSKEKAMKAAKDTTVQSLVRAFSTQYNPRQPGPPKAATEAWYKLGDTIGAQAAYMMSLDRKNDVLSAPVYLPTVAKENTDGTGDMHNCYSIAPFFRHDKGQVEPMGFNSCKKCSYIQDAGSKLHRFGLPYRTVHPESGCVSCPDGELPTEYYTGPDESSSRLGKVRCSRPPAITFTSCAPSSVVARTVFGFDQQLPLHCITVGTPPMSISLLSRGKREYWTIGCILWKKVICSKIAQGNGKPSTNVCAVTKNLRWSYADNCNRRMNPARAWSFDPERCLKDGCPYLGSETSIWKRDKGTCKQDQSLKVILHLTRKDMDAAKKVLEDAKTNGNVVAQGRYHKKCVTKSSRAAVVCCVTSKTPEYVGCFKSDPVKGTSDFPHSKGSGKTILQCQEACKTHKYFGLQGARECRCGDQHGSHGTAADCKCHSTTNIGKDKTCVYNSAGAKPAAKPAAKAAAKPAAKAAAKPAAKAAATLGTMKTEEELGGQELLDLAPEISPHAKIMEKDHYHRVQSEATHLQSNGRQSVETPSTLYDHQFHEVGRLDFSNSYAAPMQPEGTANPEVGEDLEADSTNGQRGGPFSYYSDHKIEHKNHQFGCPAPTTYEEATKYCASQGGEVCSAEAISPCQRLGCTDCDLAPEMPIWTSTSVGGYKHAMTCPGPEDLKYTVEEDAPLLYEYFSSTGPCYVAAISR